MGYKNTRSRRWGSSLLCTLAVFSLGGHAAAQPYRQGSSAVAGPELVHALVARPAAPVVVTLREPRAPLADLGARREEIASLQKSVLQGFTPSEFQLTHRWRSVSGLAGELTRAGLESLLRHPAVVRVDLDVAGAGNLAQSVPLVQADVVRNLGLTGAGVIVAVLDSGLAASHPDLAGDLVAEQCFCTNANATGCCPDGSTQQSGPGAAADDNGHGSNVTGIITSTGTVAPVGVAPDTKIVAVKVLDSQARFNAAAQIVTGLDWIINDRPEVQAVNMSLGTFATFTGYCDNATSWTMALASAINTLSSRGTVVFASSGISGLTSAMGAPACIQNTVSVGAVYDSNVGSVTMLGCTDPTTTADKVTCFSNSDTTLDLLAPGAPTTSTSVTGGTSTYYGTSQASAHAAAAAAILLQVNPHITPAQIESTLETTGAAVTDARNGLVSPRIDVLAAMRATDLIFKDGFQTP